MENIINMGKNFFKKIISVLLAISMALGLVCIASADGLTAKSITLEDLNLGDMTGKTVILHSNDVHGALLGYAYMAKLKYEYAAAGAEVILADAGDFMSGSSYVNYYKGESAIKLMDHVGYDVVGLGNHDFDYGYSALLESVKDAKFHIVCSNMAYENGTDLFEGSYTINMKSGLKISFVGVNTPELKTSTNPNNTKGISVWSSQSTPSIWQCIQKEIDRCKTSDVIITISHLGIEAYDDGIKSYDLLKNTTGIDFVIDGHSHSIMTEGEYGEKIQSTGTKFANIGVIVIDNKSKSIEDNYLISLPELQSIEHHILENDTVKMISSKAAGYIVAVEKEYKSIFAKSEVCLNGAKAPNGNRDSETNNGDLITDAFVWKAKNIGGLDVDDDHIVGIINGGAIRDLIEIGDVSMNDIHNVLPFGNTLCIVYVSGETLLNVLETATQYYPRELGGFPQVSGINFTINSGALYDSSGIYFPDSQFCGPNTVLRVEINSINGKAFNPTDTYALATNDFSAAGGDVYYELSQCKQFDIGIPVDEIVVEYVQKELNSVIGMEYAQPKGRITINPFADVDRDDWYQDYVVELYRLGIISGTSSNTFSPSKDTTWIEALKLLLVATDHLSKDESTGENWAINTLAKAADLKLVDESLDASSLITRLEFCQLVNKLLNLDTKLKESPFADSSDSAVLALYEAGIINGCSDGSFKPDDQLKRSEITKIIYQLNLIDNAA